MRDTLLFSVLAVFCVAIIYGLTLLAAADDPRRESYPIAALLLYAGLVAMAAIDVKSGKQSAEFYCKVIGMIFSLGLLWFTATHVIYFVLAFLPTLAGGLIAIEEKSTPSTASGSNAETRRRGKKLNLPLISVLVVFCGAVIFGLLQLATSSNPLQHSFPIAATLLYAGLAAMAAIDLKSGNLSAEFCCKVIGMILCIGLLWFTVNHDEDKATKIYSALVLLVILAGGLKATEKESTSGGGDLESGAKIPEGGGKLHGGDDDVENLREKVAKLGAGEDITGKAELADAQEWVERHPIYAFLAMNPSWDVSTTFFGFGFQLYGAFDETFLTVVMMVAAMVMATISVRKDYVARKQNLKDQYYRRDDSERWRRGWATYKCHDMMMDFFTCLSGYAGLFFYLAAGLGTPDAVEKAAAVIQLLNLLSVIEDAIEMFGAMFSFCIGYSPGLAAWYVVCSNALISFGGIYIIVYVMDSEIDDTTTQLGCVLVIVCGILTALYGYYCCFAELEDVMKKEPQSITVGKSSDKASQGSKEKNAEIDGDRIGLAKHVGSATLSVANAVVPTCC